MLPQTAALLIALPSVALAYKLPGHLEDGGIYSVTKDDQGNPTDFKLIGRQPAKTRRDWTPRGRGLPNLPSDAYSGCSGTILNLVDYQTAISSLLDGCDAHAPIGVGEDIIAPSGDAAAYMCNYGTSGINGCHSNEARPAFSDLKDACGQAAGKIACPHYRGNWKNSDMQ